MRHFSSLAILCCLAGFQALNAQHIQVQPAAAGSSKFLSPGSATPVIEVTSAGGLVLRANVGEAINLQETGGTNVLTITSAGKLRVGTAGTGYFLPQTGGTSGQVLTYPGSGNDLIWQTPPAADNLGNHTAAQNLDLGAFKLVGNGGTSGISVTAAGNVGIGTTSPNAQLQLANAAASRMLVLFDQNNNDHQFYGFGINGTSIRYQVESAASDHVFFSGSSASSSLEIMRVKGGGNVGIGTNNPTERLEVSGNGKFSGSMTAGSISTTGPVSVTGAGGLAVTGNATFAGTSTFNSGGNTFSLPSTRGTANQVMASDGLGGSTWATLPAIPTVSGAAGQVTYFNGASSTTSSTDLKWDNTNKRLGIGLGAGSPTEELDVAGNGKFSGNVTAIQVITSSNAQVGGSLTVSGNISTNNVSTGGLNALGTSTFNFGANSFTLPANRGTNGQAMVSDGAGAANWASIPVVSGTAGQVTYFNGTSSTTSSTDLKWDNTNKRLGIGLGAGSPSEALDVAGNGKFTGTLSVLGNATFTGAVNSFNTGANAFSMPTTRGGAGTVLGSDGTSGLIWITPYTLPGGASGGVAYYDATGTNLQNNASFFKWDNTNKRLGIGTASPTEALEVGGNVKASGTLSIGGGSVLVGTVTLNSGANTFSLPTIAGTAGQLMMSNAATTGWTTGLTWDNTNSRLGFNTNTPLANLHVKQKTAADNAATIYETTANATYTSAGVKNSGTSALSVSNATSSGVISWTTLTNAYLSDNSYATVTTSGAQQSHRIQPLGFFNPVANNVPTGATITGIMVYVERKASVASSVKDFAVQLIKAGSTAGTAKSLDEFWTTTDATVVYGSPTDTWGTSWTVANINAVNTGLDFSVTTAGAATASIDQIRMVVYYTLSNASGSTVVWSAGVADGTNKFTVAQDNTIGADQDVFAINPKGDVEIYGSYSYAFPQSRTLTINNAAFTLYSTNVAYGIDRQFTSYPIYAYMTGGTQASLGQMVASVSIPDGATITAVSARISEDLASVVSRVELVRCGDASGTVLASCLTTDIGLQTVTQELNHVVDNDLYSYALVFHGSQNSGTATNTRSLLYNVKITYLTSKAD